MISIFLLEFLEDGAIACLSFWSQPERAEPFSQQDPIYSNKHKTNILILININNGCLSIFNNEI